MEKKYPILSPFALQLLSMHATSCMSKRNWSGESPAWTIAGGWPCRRCSTNPAPLRLNNRGKCSTFCYVRAVRRCRSSRRTSCCNAGYVAVIAAVLQSLLAEWQEVLPDSCLSLAQPLAYQAKQLSRRYWVPWQTWRNINVTNYCA